jgi:(p)ppGpp synthase/HD superfamily hydrolase
MSDIENIPNKALLSDIYIKNRANYEEALAKTIRDISKLLQRKGIHPTIKSRVKDFESYFAKKIKVLKNA